MPNYLMNLVESVRSMYADAARHINIEASSDDLSLPIEKALPVGLIVNELLTNSINHGFTPGQTGYISLQLSTEKGEKLGSRLTVRDDGRGCSKESPSFSSGLGLPLVRQLALQVGGELTIDTSEGKGFVASIVFSCLPTGDRT